MSWQNITASTKPLVKLDGACTAASDTALKTRIHILDPPFAHVGVTLIFTLELIISKRGTVYSADDK